jgi:ribosomal protein S1
MYKGLSRFLQHRSERAAQLGKEPKQSLIKITRNSVLRKKINKRLAWLNIKKAFSNKTLLYGVVKDIKSDCIIVNINGIDGFLPISEVNTGKTNNFYYNIKKRQVLNVIVSTIDYNNKRFCLSLHRVTQKKIKNGGLT